jgi:hypothetical protein
VVFFFLPEQWPDRPALRRVARTTLSCLTLALVVAAVTIIATYGFTSAGAFVRSAAWQAAHTSEGHKAFFLGEYSSTGWLLYYPAAILFKTPIGTLVLLAAGLVSVVSSGDRYSVVALVVFPLLFITLTVISYVDVGVRYVLPAYPLLIVAAAAVGSATWLQRFRALPLFLVAATAVSVARIAPHTLAYFNEAAGGPLHGPALLSVRISTGART